MSIPAPSVERRAALIAAGLLTAGFLTLWLLLPDKTFVFDGVLFADVIERKGVDWRMSLYNPRHLLFNAAFQVLRDALSGLGVSVGAYRLVQVVNGLAGAAGLWLFGGLLRRLVDDGAVAVLGAALLGASWTFGTRATEGQVYMLLAFGGLWTLWAAARLLEAPSNARALDLAAAFSLTVLFHVAGAFLAPAVFAALWLAFPSRRALMLPALGLAAGIILIPYYIHFGAQGLEALTSRTAEYYRADDRGYWTGLFIGFWNRCGLTTWGRFLVSWNEAGRGFILLPEGTAAAAGLSLWAAVAGALSGAWKALDRRRRNLACVLALAWAGFVFLNAFWCGGLFFAVIPAACLLALLAAAAGPRLKALQPARRRRLIYALGAAVPALAAWNARAGLWPQSRIENNAAYDQALYIKAHTVPNSYVVIAGVVNSNLKVYIPSVAGRAREVLEYYFMANSKGEGLALLKFNVEDHAKFGIPMYILGEVLEDPRTVGEMRRMWGVSAGDIQGAFGAGRLVRMARRPDVAVYLFVPQKRRPELFVGLGYGVITEADIVRRQESVSALRMIVQEMAPAERRRTGELLRSSGWGLNLIRQGYASLMNDENRRMAETRGAAYLDYQKTADFWLHVGNLYEILGLKPEMMDAWGKAQAISGSKDMLKRILESRKSK